MWEPTCVYSPIYHSHRAPGERAQESCSLIPREGLSKAGESTPRIRSRSLFSWPWMGKGWTRLEWYMAEGRVSSEPFSSPNSLLTGKNTVIFIILAVETLALIALSSSIRDGYSRYPPLILANITEIYQGHKRELIFLFRHWTKLIHNHSGYRHQSQQLAQEFLDNAKTNTCCGSEFREPIIGKRSRKCGPESIFSAGKSISTH